MFYLYACKIVTFALCVPYCYLYHIFFIQWVPEGSPTNAGRAVKIENPNQFAPQGDNPKEFREKQKQVSICYQDLQLVKQDLDLA